MIHDPRLIPRQSPSNLQMSPEVSVVVPVCDEADNVIPLAQEIATVLRERVSFEMIFVDDGSTDGTAERLREARARGLSELRLLRHSARSGQSTAIQSGVRAARRRVGRHARWRRAERSGGSAEAARRPQRSRELRCAAHHGKSRHAS